MIRRPQRSTLFPYTTLFRSEASTKWNITRVLSSETGIEYVYNQNTSLGTPLPFTPPFSIREEIEISPNIRAKNFKNTYFAINGQYFAAQNRVDINEPTTEDYFLLNFTAGSTIIIGKNKIGLSIQIRNLTNLKYLNNMSRYRMLNLPEQGINFNISLKYEM